MSLILKINLLGTCLFSRAGAEGEGVSYMKHRVKMKYKIVLITMLLLASCSSESAPDCFQTAGDIIRDEVSVADFTKITVFENVSLVLKQGNETKVEVETGNNLRNEIEVSVENNRLLLRDTNDCNYVREYGFFKLVGETQFMGVTIAAGDSRVEASELNAQFVDVDHRGTNDILVNPEQLIKGDIRGVGDVISFRRPPLIQINELFKGKLIFKD